MSDLCLCNQIGSSELTVVNVHLKSLSVAKQQNGQSHKSDDPKAHRLSPGVQETLRGWFINVPECTVRFGVWLIGSLSVGLAAWPDAVWTLFAPFVLTEQQR